MLVAENPSGWSHDRGRRHADPHACDKAEGDLVLQVMCLDVAAGAGRLSRHAVIRDAGL
jgi:hypothetical protein